MPFKRAGWLQQSWSIQPPMRTGVSMPFKRAGWLQRVTGRLLIEPSQFQCPLSGLVGCNTMREVGGHQKAFVSMPFKRAGWLQPVMGGAPLVLRAVSMPFKRAGWLQPAPPAAD